MIARILTMKALSKVVIIKNLLGRESWLQSSKPHEFSGTAVYYNAEADNNGRQLYDFKTPVR